MLILQQNHANIAFRWDLNASCARQSSRLGPAVLNKVETVYDKVRQCIDNVRQCIDNVFAAGYHKQALRVGLDPYYLMLLPQIGTLGPT